MKRLTTFWADAIIDNRFVCITIMLTLLCLSFFVAVKFPIKYDNSFEMFMLKDDPNIVKFENCINLVLKYFV
mgnify:CR=1 FL=1